MNIAAELEAVAEAAAKIVCQERQPGDWLVLIYGTIGPDNTTTLRWEWFWRPPSETVPGHGPVHLPL